MRPFAGFLRVLGILLLIGGGTATCLLRADVDAAMTQELHRLRKDADAGRPTAQYYLGLRHLHGVGMPKDEVTAVEWFEKAARQGDPAASFNLGRMQREGRFVKPDPQRTAQLLRRAADYGIPGAREELGEILLIGEGVPADHGKALELFRDSALIGSGPAAFNLGVMHARGWGVAVDKDAAARWFDTAADRGEPNARFNVAARILAGNPPAGELHRAILLLNAAAEDGVVAAQYTLGRLSEEGRGFPQNELRAMDWYRTAAAQKHAAAMSNLARLLIKREPGKNNDSEAVKLLIEAAAQLEPSALFNLGMLREHGIGVERDPPRAAEEIRQAAWLGFGPAQMKLALLWLTDFHGLSDQAEAAAWRELARDQRVTMPGVEALDAIPAAEVEAGKHRAIRIRNEIERTRELKESGVDAATVLLRRVKPPRVTTDGYAITTDGLVLTRYIPIAGASELRIRVGGRLAHATLLAIDEAHDVAVLAATTTFDHWLDRSAGRQPESGVFRAAVPTGSSDGKRETRWLPMRAAVSGTPFGEESSLALTEVWDADAVGAPLFDESGGVAGVLAARRGKSAEHRGITSVAASEFGLAVRAGAISRLIEAAGRQWPEVRPSANAGDPPNPGRAVVTVLGF